MDNLSKEQSLYRFITNEGEFFTDDYLDESFADRVYKNSFLFKCSAPADSKKDVPDGEEDFESGTDDTSSWFGIAGGMPDSGKMKKMFSRMKELYGEYKAKIHDSRSGATGIIRETYMFHGKLLDEILWYRHKVIGGVADSEGKPAPYSEIYYLNGPDDKDKSIVPVRHVIRRKTDDSVQMLIMEMQPEIENGDYAPGSLCEQTWNDGSTDGGNKSPQCYFRIQWRDIFQVPEGYHISPSVIRDAISEICHGEKSLRPEYILLLAGPKIYLIKTDVWDQQSYLMLDIDELVSGITASKNAESLFRTFWLLISAPELLRDSGLLARLIDDNRNHAYSVTSELKVGVVNVIKILGNEASDFFGKHHDSDFYRDYQKTGKEDRDRFHAAVLNDCLIYVYRLLFIFFAESRKGELGLVPERDDVYDMGYSLERLRVLALRNLRSRGETEDFFFDNSMRTLFELYGKGSSDLIINNGYRPEGKNSTEEWLRRIDSPIFSDDGLTYFRDLRIRNTSWQKILKNLSVTQKKDRNGRVKTGLINYAALGVNQLGAVYENLMSYRCYYADRDLIQVHNKDDNKPDLYLLDAYDNWDKYDFETEVVHDPKDRNRPLIINKGTFVYWLSTLDRSRSASYYTPVSLTRSTVKFTLQGIRDRIEKGETDYREILDLKIFEPAMGAAAFQNEVIDQLAELYLDYAIKEESHKSDGKKLKPEDYRSELTRVKAYIATRNVYGVDMNPHALELGKLALWLNTIHKGMEPPFFVNRLCVGNAVLGTSLTFYETSNIKYDDKKAGYVSWWECRNPARVEFPAGKNKKKRGFKRAKDSFYTFLLPTGEMGDGLKLSPKLDITGWKSANKGHIAIFKKKLDSWTKPLKSEDIARLVRISKAFDVKLKLYYQYQAEITRISAVISDVWPQIGKRNKNGETDLIGGSDRANFRQKTDLLNLLEMDGSPASQVRTVMNYWCALWFWPVEEFANLPDRNEYWSDLEAILAIDDMTAVKTSASQENTDEWEIFVKEAGIQEEFQEYKPHMKYEDLVKVSDEIEKKRDKTFWDSTRIRIVKETSLRKKFCHQELEFLEVFWERGGFDVIAGNPPWVIPSFDIQSVLSEKDPSADVKRLKSPDALKEAARRVSEDHEFECFYEKELLENSRDMTFININNPELPGKNDLYRIILARSLKMLSPRGFMGLVHPTSVFTDTNGGDFRRKLYHYLRYHFRYVNERMLFPDVGHHKVFSVNIYRGFDIGVSFYSVTGLYLPEELDFVFRKGSSDSKRLVHFTEKELEVVRNVFDPENDSATSVILVVLSNDKVLQVLANFCNTEKRVRDFNPVITSLFNDTTAVKDGFIHPENRYPEQPINLILVGPQLTVGNPLFQCPRKDRKNKAGQDTIDLTNIGDDYLPRTTFVPADSLSNFRALSVFADTEMRLKDYPKSTNNKNELEKLQCEELLKHYKVSFRAMLNLESSRSVHAAIISPEISHTNGIKSVFFKNDKDVISLGLELMSLPYDFFMKIKGGANFDVSTFLKLPMFLFKSQKHQNMAFVRVLILNCLTSYYRSFWESNFSEEFKKDSWSITDFRLKSFSTLEREWNWNIPLRNDFERRQALVEIDVLVAMAMGFTLEELQFMYKTKFRVLKDNEANTWYDSTGRIVFTVAQSDVGVERPVFEEFQKKAAQGQMEFRYTVCNNQLYNGEEIIYKAPFNKCDRIKDYEIAWKHFSEILASEDK